MEEFLYHIRFYSKLIGIFTNILFRLIYRILNILMLVKIKTVVFLYTESLEI